MTLHAAERKACVCPFHCYPLPGYSFAKAQACKRLLLYQQPWRT
ncbi:hypothetical protein, unlikely [Trypanosoma brucei gambiense DAL972]|uniref:Uncharacterized protein n=1 Tax=Trypanosoma brucei gambiense (strain MHOM/CI/86/DAL972) TaxID=679716 RepID=C9ZIL3_TRYB9|nr:hypothetical protein, unlikely [Trypanosoma brucei gambiense DAL972]CBH09005.1 hypothetical protein, unlikely [Trypanosoma brucei gambiense DAL972]|eukprot:XP_011771446.1 hypothetical protein, unlikely [Trypanosoma brucei gambiense DAL972]